MKLKFVAEGIPDRLVKVFKMIATLLNGLFIYFLFLVCFKQTLIFYNQLM